MLTDEKTHAGFIYLFVSLLGLINASTCSLPKADGTPKSLLKKASSLQMLFPYNSEEYLHCYGCQGGGAEVYI